MDPVDSSGHSALWAQPCHRDITLHPLPSPPPTLPSPPPKHSPHAPGSLSGMTAVLRLLLVTVATFTILPAAAAHPTLIFTPHKTGSVFVHSVLTEAAQALGICHFSIHAAAKNPRYRCSNPVSVSCMHALPRAQLTASSRCHPCGWLSWPQTWLRLCQIIPHSSSSRTIFFVPLLLAFYLL